MPNTEVNSCVHVVAGLIRHPKNSSRLFFTRRKEGQHLENLWEFPGGKIERGESRFHALQRELREEVDIQVISAHPFHRVTHQYKDKKVHLDVWEIDSFTGSPHGQEGQESIWMDFNEVSQYPFPEADIPVLKALMLPSELLITPDLSEQYVDSYIQQFTSLMKKHRYPLVQFRSHHLNDETYQNVALKLKQICVQNRTELIINRPTLKSLESKLFESFHRRHLNSLVLGDLTSSPFDKSVVCSASCHDIEELRMAEKLNCEFAVLSTVRSTASHPGRTGKGWYKFNNLSAKSRIPVYALGGVRRKDLSVARYQGAIGVAGISDFWVV